MWRRGLRVKGMSEVGWFGIVYDYGKGRVGYWDDGYDEGM